MPKLYAVKSTPGMRESYRKYYRKNREARNAATRKWAAKNREYVNARGKAWMKANPEKRHGYHLKQRFGISSKDYLALLAEQGGGCAICGKRPEEEARRLAIDHNHTTMEIRAILCNNCNTLIGHSLESTEILHKAIAYLEKHNGK